MFATEWHGKFVADLPSKSSGLGEFEMVGIAWGALADQAGLCRHEDQMGLVARHDGLAQGRHQLSTVLAFEPWRGRASVSGCAIGMVRLRLKVAARRGDAVQSVML